MTTEHRRAGFAWAIALASTAAFSSPVWAQPNTFDEPSDWYSNHGDPIELTATANTTDGSGALSIPIKGFTRIRSVPFAPGVSQPEDTWSLDVFIPTDQTRWVSYVEVVVRIASEQMWWNVIDYVKVQNLPRGQYNTILIQDVPADVQAAIQTASDVEIIINMNAADTGASWLLDNLDFTPTATETPDEGTGDVDYGDGAAPLGFATPYNAFALRDFNGYGSDVEGRIAVGGGLMLEHYSIGLQLDRNTAEDSVVVGGDFDFVEGGSIREGNVVTGGRARIADNVLIARSGSTITENSSRLPVDFARARTNLRQLSGNYARRDVTGSTSEQWGHVYFTGDGRSDVQVFELDAALGLDAHTFHIDGVPSNAHILINVNGVSAGFESLNTRAL